MGGLLGGMGMGGGDSEPQEMTYYSGTDNPSMGGEDPYFWMPMAGKTIGTIIGQYYGGPIGGKIGGAVGNQAGTDISRIAEGDEVAKVGWDSVFNMMSNNPMGDKMPGNKFIGMLGNLGADIFGWK